MKTIKRLKKEAEEVFAPAIEDLNAKYGVAMKDRTMLTIERNKLMKRVKGLEKELEELRDAQTKKKKTKKEEEEEKAKAKAKPTSKVATRVKAIEHKVAKAEEERGGRRRRRKGTKRNIVCGTFVRSFAEKVQKTTEETRGENARRLARGGWRKYATRGV